MLAVFALLVGGSAVLRVDGRDHTRTVPLLPWCDDVHFVGGGIALLVGVWCLRVDLLLQHPRRHRWLGRVYVASVFASGAAGFLMAFFAAGGTVGRLAMSAIAAAWMVTTGLGLVAIRARRVLVHRRWLLRSYALCCAAITLRVELPLVMLVVDSYGLGFTITASTCWLPNVLFVEWWLRRTAADGRASRDVRLAARRLEPA